MIKKIISLGVLLVFIFAFAAAAGCGETEEEETMENTIIVVVKKEYADKDFTVKDFKEVKAVRIMHLTKVSCEYIGKDLPESFRKIYSVVINKRKQTVEKAVEVLSQSDYFESIEAYEFEKLSGHYEKFGIYDEKRYTKVMPFDRMYDDADDILIVIDKNFTHKKFTAADFYMIDVILIENLMEESYERKKDNLSPNFRNIYAVTIKNKGKQNVANAVRKVEKLDFVLSVGPGTFFQGLNLVD